MEHQIKFRLMGNQLLMVAGIPVIIMATNQTEKASLKRVAFLRSQTILLFRKKLTLWLRLLCGYILKDKLPLAYASSGYV